MNLPDVSSGIDDKLSLIDDRLSSCISKFFGKPQAEVKAHLAQDLGMFLSVAPQKEALLSDIKKLIEEKEQIQRDYQEQKERDVFLLVEEEVLKSLSVSDRERIARIRKLNFGSKHVEKIYRQVINKLHTGEISISSDGVAFHYAGKFLYRQELQMPLTTKPRFSWKKQDLPRTVYDKEYIDFHGQKILRREIKIGPLSVYSRHKVLEDEIALCGQYLQDPSTHIATWDHTFKPIFDGFDGDDGQKVRALQFLAGFVGSLIVPGYNNNDHLIFPTNYRPKSLGNYIPICEGSLFVSRDI